MRRTRRGVQRIARWWVLAVAGGLACCPSVHAQPSVGGIAPGAFGIYRPTTVAGMVACVAGIDGRIVAVTDGASATDCVTGAGTYPVLCQCDGGATTWRAVQSAGGAGDIAAVGDCSTGSCFQAETARYVFAAPGAGGVASFRALVEADVSDLAHTVDTNAATICTGTTTYLDGEGNCDTITSGAANLADLDDVDLTGVAAGDVLAYPAAGTTWVPRDGGILDSDGDGIAEVVSTPGSDVTLNSDDTHANFWTFRTTRTVAGIFKQWDGTAGDGEVRIWHDKSNGYVWSVRGALILHGGTTAEVRADANKDGASDFTVKADRVHITPEATAPAACVIGDFYVDTSGAYCACTATNTWTNTTGVGTCV